ncbi:MAG: RagB/SusD family nutrient uptake outer membrane protein, partial [Muribaculaceae bacterium]|nr:RagB/SusD family nutrient uptake outer membrane protein [Muribaculaceae bacterium]
LYKKRDDRGVVVDSIMSDLNKAIKLLPSTKDQTHVTRWTALALKSRVALFEGTWRKYRGMTDADKYLKQAAEAAEDFIDNSGYKLYTTGATPYRDMFNSIDCVSDEVILARKYSQSANVMHSIVFNLINGRTAMTKRFMNHYLMADGSFYSSQTGYATKGFTDEVTGRDPRLSQTILTPGYVQTGATATTINSLTSLTGYEPIKFVGSSAYTGANKGISDYPLMRAAEVYLNFAEAKAELGTLTQSDLDKSINKIRDRAKMGHMDMTIANSNIDPLMREYYPNVTQSANTGVILEIRRERTVELALEGFRLWDLFRWKEGQALTKPLEGIYFAGAGEYDMNADDTPDLLLYRDNAGNFTGTIKKLGKDVILYKDTYGYINPQPGVTITWDESRDYLW